jgi:long-chain acyl-CoA synthetase
LERNVLNKKQLLINCFKNFSENVFLVEKNGTNISYGDFYNRSLRLLSFLYKKFKKGSRIIVKSRNSKDYLIFYAACLLGGYTVCPVDPDINKKKLKYIKKIFKIKNQINNLDNLNYENQKISNDIEFSSKVDFLIVFTSGTSTGESKGILHNSESVLGCAEAYSKSAGYDIETRIYHCLPMYYMAGISNTFFACIFSGSSIIIGDQISATNLNNFWIIPEKLKANSLHLVPSLY